jgi:WD40 repeat protein
LATAIGGFVIGVDSTLIDELVEKYDIDNDGNINIEEFSKFILSRYSVNKDDYLTIEDLHKSSFNSASNNSIFSNIESRAASREANEETPHAVEYAAKLYLTNLKAILLKKVSDIKASGKIPRSEVLKAKSTEFTEDLVRRIVAKEFQPYLQGKSTTFVDFITFKRVMHKFVYPGSKPATDKVLLFLFQACSDDNNPDVCDPDLVLDLLFDKGGHKVNQYGFIQPIAAATDTGRPSVKEGPIVPPKATDQFTMKISDIPFRYNTKHCRTALAVPSNFTIPSIHRSAAAPTAQLARKYVYGFNNSLYCGDPMVTFNDTMLIYSSAAVGIIHDIADNVQYHLDGHTDDISCIAIDSANQYCATGQVGRSPVVLLWALSGAFNGIAPQVVGKGFFERAVNAVGFSHDSRYLHAIGCDDKHQMGIWDVATLELLTTVSVTNGVPPQIKASFWSPELLNTEFITKEHLGSLNDVIVTVSDKVIRFWSFNRSNKVRGSNTVIMDRTSRLSSRLNGKEAPKVWTCAAFFHQRSGCSIVVGNTNGYIYVFQDGIGVDCYCMMKDGSVNSIKISNSYVFVGCSQGSVKMLDVNFNVVNVFSVLPSNLGVSDELRPSSGARPSTGTTGGGVAAFGGQVVSNPKKKPNPKSTAAKSTIKLGQIKEETLLPVGDKGSSDVMGMTLLYESSTRRGTTEPSALVVSTGFGRLLKINLDNKVASINTVAYYHYAPVWALGVSKLYFVTGGDDKWLSVWDNNNANRSLLVRAKLKAPIRCIDISRDNGDSKQHFITVGTAGGVVVMYYLQIKPVTATSIAFQRSNVTRFEYTLRELSSRRDTNHDMSDIKFSPNNNMVAVGSHDNIIHIYSTNIEVVQNTDKSISVKSELKYLKKLKGHSSYITHLDWSIDNRLIQSTCGGYELLYWDVRTGKQLLSTTDALEADTVWHTDTCVLGFHVMGIWSKYSDGTDVNSVDSSKRHQIVVSGDDFGQVNIFNYPCVVKNAPRRTYHGHSSHVMNVKVHNDSYVVSVGGNDNSIMSWEIQL